MGGGAVIVAVVTSLVLTAASAADLCECSPSSIHVP